MDSTRTATLIISVDIAKAVEETPVVTGLLDVLRRHRAPALWSLEFQNRSSVVDRIHGAWSAHEFGVLARSNWAASETGRTVFARELASRIDSARELGITPTALAMQSDDLPAHLDLLVKHQIALVRMRSDIISGKIGALQPRLSRYGIWQSEPAMVIPVGSRWSLPWTARRLMQQAITRNQTMHLAVDGERLATNLSAGLGSLDYVLKLASARRESGSLQMMGISQVLEACSPRREQFHSRSVLRVA